MSGWLGCCECLQRRAMAPARRHGAAMPAAPPPQQGHHNAAFLGDEEVATPSSPPPPPPPPTTTTTTTATDRQPEQPSGGTAELADLRPPPSPPVERYRAVPRPIRPQFREVCDLRDERPGVVRRFMSRQKTRAARSAPRPQSPHGPAVRPSFGSSEERLLTTAGSGPFLPSPRDLDAEWPTEELVVLDLQRRVSQLDNIPETSETAVSAPSGDGAGAAAAQTAAAAQADESTGSENRASVEEAPERPSEVSKSVSPAPGVKWDDTVDRVESRPDSPTPASPSRPTARARAASLGTPRRLTFPRLRWRSSQRRQSTGGATRPQSSREPSRERSWLRRFSRSRPSSALKADQPPEQPTEQTVEALSSERSLAAQRWNMLRSNFDLDAPLTEHWGFLESVVNKFEKVDAKTYTEHLHEQSPLSSSSSEEEVPDALEAQLLMKLAQAEKIRARKSPVSRRCVQNERQRRREQRRASAGEEPSCMSEHNGHFQGDSKDRGRSVVDESSPAVVEAKVREVIPLQPLSLGSAAPVVSIAEESRASPLSWGADPSGSGRLTPNRRTSSCPPPQSEPTAGRRQRGSIFGRLLGMSTGHSSLPGAAQQSDDDQDVHHPTWFQRAAGPEAAAGPTPDQRTLTDRRATVTEVALREFLDEVDERAQHLRDEEFCGADPYEVLAPEQRAADDDHVVPLLNTSRCVNLMVADAERRLEREYGTGSRSPSLRPSQCPTPRRCAEDEIDEGSQEGPPAGSSGSNTVGGVKSAESDRNTAGGSGTGPSDKQTADSSGVRSSDKQGSDSRSGSPEKHAGAAIGSHEDHQTIGTGSDEAGPSGEHFPGSSPPGQLSQCPSQCPPEVTSQPDGHRCRRDTPADLPASHSRAQAASPVIGTKLGRLPAYLTGLQHEMATAAESLRAKLQATLGSTHDAEPSTARSKSPPKPVRKRTISGSSDAERSVAEFGAGPSSAAAVPPATPRNSISQATEQVSPVDSVAPPSGDLTPASTMALPPTPAPLALVGYQQMALALARHSTVGYRDLALALARQETAAAVEVNCQGVQTSPGIGSPAERRSGPAAGLSRSVQTSPGVVTPAEAETAASCGHCAECAQNGSPSRQTDHRGGPSAAQCAPTCPRKGSCTQRAPSVTPGAPSAVQCAPDCHQSASCARGESSCSHCDVCPNSGPEPSPSGSKPASISPSSTTAAAADSSPAPECASGVATPPTGGTVWTVAIWDGPRPGSAAPPARLLAYGQPSWVARQQSSDQTAELRRRIDSGQRAASRRRDSLLRRRANRAAELAAPTGRHSGDHERADVPARLGRR